MSHLRYILIFTLVALLTACAGGPSSLTLEEIDSLSTVELCDFYREEQTDPIHEALLTRGFSEGDLVNIKGGWVLNGMNHMQVRCAWGQPDRINTTQYGDITRRQLVYRRFGGSAKYVYLEDGVVVSKQY